MSVINKQNDYLSKLEILKQINDSVGDDFNLNSYITGESNVFEQIIELSETLFLNGDLGSSNSLETILQYSVDSIEKVNNTLKKVILNNVKKSLFVGEGVCGTEQIITNDMFSIKPSEFDLLDLLKINPETPMGVLLYEDANVRKNPLNRQFYEAFSGTNILFKSTRDNSLLFNMEWDSSAQEYKGVIRKLNVGEFLEHYYASIELPVKKNILKSNLVDIMKISTTSLSFDKKKINLDKILGNIFKDCNEKNKDEESETFVGVYTDIVDDSGGFTFDVEEGLIDEVVFYPPVMKFSNCEDLEVEIKEDLIDDLDYLMETETNLNDAIGEIIEKTSYQIVESTEHSLEVPNVKIGILKDFILNLPKCMMRSIFTPKLIFPIVLMYKKINNVTTSIAVNKVMGIFGKLFNKIIKETFWSFIEEMWSKIKKLLTKTLKKIGSKIIKNNNNRVLTMITRLMSIVKSIPINNFDGCNSLYEVIIRTIDTVINTRNNVTIPNAMLLLSDKLGGFSKDRSVLNIVEILNQKGINTSPIYGEENNLVKIVDSIISGYTTELDENGYVKIVLKEGVLPSSPGGTVIPPGIISGVGKLF